MTDEIIAIASAFTSTLAPFLPKIIGTATKYIGDGFDEFVKEGGKTLFDKLFAKQRPPIVDTLAEKITANNPALEHVNELSLAIAEKIKAEPVLANELKDFVEKAKKQNNFGSIYSYNYAEKIIVINNSNNFNITM